MTGVKGLSSNPGKETNFTFYSRSKLVRIRTQNTKGINNHTSFFDKKSRFFPWGNSSLCVTELDRFVCILDETPRVALQPSGGNSPQVGATIVFV